MIKEYEKMTSYSPEIAKLTLEHLSRTKTICYDIPLFAETLHLESEGKENKLKFLFRWNRIEKKNIKDLGSI